jgi:hypothetical protein
MIGLLRTGKLSQRCPCGVVEAAGSYCTRCLRPMTEADWFTQDRGRPRSVAREAPENGINRGRTPTGGVNVQDGSEAA